MKYKPIFPDYLMVLSLILFLGCHIITNYLIWNINGVANQIGAMEDIGIQFEANPITKYIFQLGFFKTIYSYVFMPGLLFGTYYLFRKKNNIDSVIAFAVAICVMAFSNFLNDLSILLGVLM